MNETIYYQFDDVRKDLHLIKEHYIILDENDNIIYDFYYDVSSRGSRAQNANIFKDKNL